MEQTEQNPQVTADCKVFELYEIGNITYALHRNREEKRMIIGKLTPKRRKIRDLRDISGKPLPDKWFDLPLEKAVRRARTMVFMSTRRIY